MGFNKKELSKATANLDARKAQSKPRDIIYDPAGQWKHPGQPTRIPGGDITMRDVPYPVMAYPNVGQPQMMYPEQNYNFPNADYVDEYPQMKKGGLKKYSRDITATNRLFTKNPFLKKKKSKKRKIFDPNSQYFQYGGLPTSIQDEPDVIYTPSMQMSSGGMTQYKEGGKLGPIPINSGRKVLRDWTYGESIGMLQEQDGGELPADYQEFINYSETAPENRRPAPNAVYGDPNDYDHYGMWETLGKPKNFEEALQMNPDWTPDEYDGMYHGFSVNPNTGVFLKAGKPGFKEGDTTWMEVAGHYLSPRAQVDTPVFDIDLQRFRYIPNENQEEYIETELTPEEIEVYREGGYVVEEVDKFQKGGTKTHKSKDGTVTNTIQNPDGTQTIQVKTKDGKYFEKTTPVNYEKQLDKLKQEYRDQQDYNKLLNYAGVIAYPASVASSYSDVQKGNYGDALLGLVPFVGPRSRLVNNAAKATLEAGTNAGLSYIKALSNANKIKKVVPISTGATQINDVIKQDGGPIETELTPEEIEWYKSQGYEVEELD
jgi:hypothetical protein